ncbi:MAG: hypothetical protein RLZZ230_498 [Candidatus Parcubacteria bacterium]
MESINIDIFDDDGKHLGIIYLREGTLEKPNAEIEVMLYQKDGNSTVHTYIKTEVELRHDSVVKVVPIVKFIQEKTTDT